jgi:MoaA/NifB/PqqE/SkfB family radical SAM enzyme
MKTRLLLRNLFEGTYRNRPVLKRYLRAIDAEFDRLSSSVAQRFPGWIRPEPRRIYLSLTAACNLRCKGCRYGRDFMVGEQLSLPMVQDVLDDAKELGFEMVRLYGGEPLLHKQIVEIVEYCTRLGVRSYMTTNGIILKSKIDDLFAAGLRRISVGFYGVGAEYDRYVQRKDRFRGLEENLGYVRERYGERIFLGLNWLLMKPTCNLEAVHATWRFAQRFQMPIFINLLQYSLPYFTEGAEGELRFVPGDRPAIEQVVDEFIRLQRREPELLPTSPIALRSIPDWLIKGPDMRIPCDRRRLIWVGADGTVQMCYVTFKLGNLHETRLKDMLFTDTHINAARDAFALNCPNCNCSYQTRTLSGGASPYRQPQPSRP